MKLKSLSILTTTIAFLIGVGSGVFLGKGYGVKLVNRLTGAGSSAAFQAKPIGSGDSSISAEHQGKLQLFILAGQSNMSGVGDLPATEAKTNPKIYVFGNDYRWKLAKEPVDAPTNQVDMVSEDKPAGFGPSVSFATTLLEQRPTMAIGLIPCAKGGSLIHEWRRNLSDSTLYGSCLKRVRAASTMGEVAGLLFFQGEIDAVDPAEFPQRTFSPNRWADEFTTLVKDWRRDLNLPKLPVVFAQIGTNTEPARFKNWAVVQEQQRQVQLPFTAMITTKDLALKDYVHFKTESYQIIGQRFAKAYLNVASVAENQQQN